MCAHAHACGRILTHMHACKHTHTPFFLPPFSILLLVHLTVRYDILFYSFVFVLQHYYNIPEETLVDDISPSTSHDSQSEAYCQCNHDNTLSTSSHLTCTSVFCSQCGLNTPEYINKVVDNTNLQKNTTQTSMDSCDSGVHESVSDRPSISVSEFTPTDSTAVDIMEDQPGAYLKLIASNTVEQGHRPCKPSISKPSLPTITAAESVQSLCSNCRVPTITAAESVQSLCSNCRAECGQQEIEMESLKMKQGSILSLCSTCKVQLDCESQTAAESITIDMDCDTHSTHAANHSYYNTKLSLGACLGIKDPLEAQKSNDSGVMSVCSDTWEGYVWNKYQHDQNLKVLSDCATATTTTECSDQYPHPVDAK